LSTIIVDASVGVKWFLPEVHAAEGLGGRRTGKIMKVETDAVAECDRLNAFNIREGEKIRW